MSCFEENITLTPPAGLSFATAAVERFISKTHRCPVCNGRGGFRHGEYTDENIRYEKCPMCAGTGKIKALISVIWTPTGEVKEQFKTETLK